ncbi:MAG TPA: HAD family hydrolase [Methanotrichaceae archaeon]|nr:HAD family hydrolase [Methanotrichaceae archaeon]
MPNIDGIKGIMFDCYKTLIDIKTDERSIKTYEPVSRWLMYQGVKISPEALMNEYKWRCKVEIERCWEMHREIKVEEIFSKICRNHASWDINDVTVGVEAARIFRSSSLRRLQAFPQSVRLLEKLSGYPMGIVSNGQRVFSELEVMHLGLHNHFRFILFSSDFGFKKPDHRIFLEGAGKLSLRPDEIMYIGDSFENDINPSRQVGMKAMHINEAWKFFNVA